MNVKEQNRGAAPVGMIDELPAIEATAVLYLRLWCEGGDTRARIGQDFQLAFGADEGAAYSADFDQLVHRLTRQNSRPLMRHGLECKCFGGDESAFANLLASASEGDHQLANLFAMNLTRSLDADSLALCAARVGCALAQMVQRAPKYIRPTHRQPARTH